MNFEFAAKLNLTEMASRYLEFFKLDEIDQKVFFWLIGHVKIKAVKSWSEYIEEEYRRRQIIINSDRLFDEGLKFARDYPQLIPSRV